MTGRRFIVVGAREQAVLASITCSFLLYLRSVKQQFPGNAWHCASAVFNPVCAAVNFAGCGARPHPAILAKTAKTFQPRMDAEERGYSRRAPVIRFISRVDAIAP